MQTHAPHQQRVIDEKNALDDKATKLSAFIGKNPLFEKLDAAEQERLKIQNDLMWQYSEVLGQRIAAFGPPDCIPPAQTPIDGPIRQTKEFRKALDAVLQEIKLACGEGDPSQGIPVGETRQSRERDIAITKIQEAIMWLGMDLKDIGTANPYPESYNPESLVIEPTADGLKL